MAGSEETPAILNALPVWAQIATSLGVFVGVGAAACYGYLKNFKAAKIAEGHDRDLAQVEETLLRLAKAAEELVRLASERRREEEIEKEVLRRLGLRDQSSN